jgi:quercetin dioxygenase-like cupin family protein
MAGTAHDVVQPRPHATPVSTTYTELDLPAELRRLQEETTWSTGQNAKTLVKYDTLRVVLVALKAGKTLAEHRTEGRISIQVMSGHIEVKAAGRTFNLHAGGLLALDRNVAHDVRALQESAVLLTVAWPGERVDIG